MMAGHHADAVYWWVDGKGFATSAYAGPAGPAVTAASDAFDRSLFDRWRAAPPQLWPTALPQDCSALVQPHRFGAVDVSGGVPPSDAPAVSAGFLGRTDFYDGLHASPSFDPLALDFAATLVDRDGLGQGPATDLLALSLSATDYVGHRYGNGGAEMCAQLHALDEALGQFLAKLDGLGVPYVVVLTADHGAIDAAERAAEHGVAAQRIDGAGLVKALNQHLEEQFSLAYEPIIGDDPQQLYLNVAGDAALIEKIRDETVAWLKARKEVAAVLTAAEVAAAAPPTGKPVERLSLAERFHESYDPARSGDIAVALAEYATIGTPRGPGDVVAGHGSPWDYDRRVPILFWWRGITPADRGEAIETVDIAPTLAPLIGLAAPPVDGHCLVQVTSSCPAVSR
jgi:predicted AlkP superfamily pyrophosphatase or phosphodiesterase